MSRAENDPLVRMIRAKGGRGARSHGLIKESALDDASARELLAERIANAGPDDTFEIVKMRKGWTPDSHAHLHTHNAGTDQEYEHEHGHDHVGGLHFDAEGSDAGDHQHDHFGKSVKASTTKASPLVDRSQNPIVGRTPAPAAAPVPTRGARSTGASLDTSPAGAVASIDVPRIHRHEGTKEGVRAYWHNHPASYPVGHDPDDPNDVVDNDRRDHLSDPRHVAALRGFGGWEAKSAGASPADAIKAVQADSEKVRGHMTNRNVPLGLINARLADNAAAIGQLSMSAEVAQLRKAAGWTQTKRLMSTVQKRAHPELDRKLGALDQVLALTKEREALRPYLDHPDFNVRAGAKELMAQKLAEIEKVGRADVTKAAPAMSMTPELAKMIRGAVDKAFEDLGARIEELNRRP